MEHDTKSMIESARRMARRLARNTGTAHQTCLDDVARQLGREHWAAYARDPVPVPRATAQDEADRTGRVVNHEGGVALPPALAAQIAAMTGNQYDAERAAKARAYNVLLTNAASEPVHSRDDLVENAADILMGDMLRPGYFDLRGRDALVAFMHWEMAVAKAEGRDASVSSMVRGMRDGLDEMGRGPTVTGDEVGDWLTAVAETVGDDQPAARATLLDLSSVNWKERSGILGTMDRALAAFAPMRAAA